MIGDEQQCVRHCWTSLQNEWAQTRQQWGDDVGEQFEKEFWRDIQDQVPGLLTAMEALDEVLDQALHSTDE